MLCVYLGTQKTGDLGKEINSSEAVQLIQDKKIAQVWYQGANFRMRLAENSSVKDAKDFPANADYHFVIGTEAEQETIIKLILETKLYIEKFRHSMNLKILQMIHYLMILLNLFVKI